MNKTNLLTKLLLLCLCVVGSATSVWADDKYYLFTPTNASVSPVHEGELSGDFYCTQAVQNGSNTIDGLTFPKYVKTASSTSTSASWTTNYAGRLTFDYDMKTTSTTFTIYAYVNGSTKYGVCMASVQEGSDPTSFSAVTGLSSFTGAAKGSVTVTATTNKRVRFGTSNSSNVYIYQIVATETGTALPQPAGTSDYTLDFTKKRFAVEYASSAPRTGFIDGIKAVVNSDIKYNGTAAKLTNTSSSHTYYIQFSTGSTEGVKLKVTTKSDVAFSLTKSVSEFAKSTTASKAETTLDANTTYYIQGNNAEITVNKIEFIAPSIPYLTGAWKISSTDVTGQTANVVQGSSAPTMPTFTVGATSGDPAASDYTVTYSETGISGIFTYTDGVPTGISTTTAGSATVTATLTTNDDSKFKTPATNTFTYTVTVSEASAPEISIDGDASVARDGELTLTATATGVPTPTIEWFLCDAEGNSKVPQGEASTSNTTFNVSTETVGTYYIVAAANNGIGGDAYHDVFSDVKTITVVPKAPTLTAGGLFVGDSKSVTIDKANDEDGSATIKYKIGDGEWTAYSETLSIAATSTVYAKVEQDGLTSAEASATYTKFEKNSVTAVSAGKTWNWSNITSESLELSGSTTPILDDEFYTYSDIASLNSLNLGTFDGETIAFSGQYPVRNNAFQNGAVKIVTTVPGTISVDFSDTGSKYAGAGESDYESNPNRYLNVNGVNTEHYVRRTGKANGKVTDKVVSVPAGEITIKGMKADGETAVAIMVYKIVFTPTPGPAKPTDNGTTVTLTTTSNMAGWRAYYNADNNYSADPYTKVYVAASDPEGDVITLTRIAGVPAGVPVILHKTGDEDDNTTITLTKEEAGTYTYNGNNLLAVTNGSDAINNVYRLGWNSTSYVGFYPYSGTPAAGTVYLNVSSAEARALTIAFDEDGETTAIKAIDNEQLTIDNYYDLQGRKVAQPQKGLYIVNGKKVIVK